MFELYLALVLFAFVSSVTPGPNNIMLLASGANFGFIKTIPHMLGISIGHVFMTILIGTLIMEIFKLYPITFIILKIFCGIYLIYFAWKIATISINKEDKSTGKPFSFYQAAIFQWVNPKAWAILCRRRFNRDIYPRFFLLGCARTTACCLRKDKKRSGCSNFK